VIRSAPECAGDFQAWGRDRGSARNYLPRKVEPVASSCARVRRNSPECSRDRHDLGTPEIPAPPKAWSLLGSSDSFAPSAATTSVRRLSDRTFSPRLRGVSRAPPTGLGASRFGSRGVCGRIRDAGRARSITDSISRPESSTRVRRIHQHNDVGPLLRRGRRTREPHRHQQR